MINEQLQKQINFNLVLNLDKLDGPVHIYISTRRLTYIKKKNYFIGYGV